MGQKDKTKSEKRTSWLGMLIAGVLTLMLCLTINFRAFSNLGKETRDNESLQQRIETTTSENLTLQEEIHYLKNDPKTVEREVKRFGLAPPKKKVSVPTNK